MPTLAEIRSQYPQYGDMSDQQLGDALHKKFYSDIPRPEFDQKLGLNKGATDVPPEATSDVGGVPVRFGGSTVIASEVPKGQAWEQAQKTLVDLESQGVPQTDPRYQQALKDKALGLQRLSTGGMEMLGGPGVGGKAAGKVISEAAPAITDAYKLATGATLREASQEEMRAAGALTKAQGGVSDVGEATDKSTLGHKMFQDLSGRVNKLLKERGTTATELKKEYLSEGAGKEKEIAQSYRDYLKQLLGNRLHPEQEKVIGESARNLEKDPSIETMVIERRRLNDIASGTMRDYGAVEKGVAQNLAAHLTGIIRKEVPSYAKFLDKYSEMSHDVNLFEDTALGQRVTKETSDFLPDVPKFDPATLPANMFKTKNSIQILKKLSGGNEKMVQDAASEHVATELSDLNATQARKWIEKNREWLEEVPTVMSDAEKYVSNLEKASLTAERMKSATAETAKATEKTRRLIGQAGASAAGGGAAYYGLRHFGF